MKKIALVILLISSQLSIGMERQNSWKLASKMDLVLTVIMLSKLLPYIEFIEIAGTAIEKPTFTNNSLQNLTANMFMLNTIKKYTPGNYQLPLIDGNNQPGLNTAAADSINNIIYHTPFFRENVVRPQNRDVFENTTMHEMGHLQYKHFQQRVAARLLIPAALEIPFYIIKRNLYSTVKLESAQLLSMIILTECTCVGFQNFIGDILFYALCRQQERQADAFALNALEKAEGQLFLYRFFINNAAKENEKLSTREKITKKIMEPLHAIFSTHPSNKERLTQAIKKQREFMILKTLPFLSLRKDRFRYSQLALNRHRILVKNRLLALRSTK